MQNTESTLEALVSVLRAAPESDALVILGRLMDSLPIGFHVSDCGGAFHVLYANRVWERWLGPEKLPVAGKRLADLFPSAEDAGVLRLMREVCQTAQPKHLTMVTDIGSQIGQFIEWKRAERALQEIPAADLTRWFRESGGALSLPVLQAPTG